MVNYDIAVQETVYKEMNTLALVLVTSLQREDKSVLSAMMMGSEDKDASIAASSARRFSNASRRRPAIAHLNLREPYVRAIYKEAKRPVKPDAP